MDDKQMVLTMQVQVLTDSPDSAVERQDELGLQLLQQPDVLAVWMPTPRIAGREQLIVDREDACYLLESLRNDLEAFEDARDDSGMKAWLEQRIELLEAQLSGTVEVVGG